MRSIAGLLAWPRTIRRPGWQLTALLAIALLASGCRALLPAARDDTQVQWQTFDEARDAIDAIVPFHTTRAELAAAGLDPIRNPSITLLGYPDIAQRFSSGSAVLPQQLDPGVHLCLASGKSCTGYAVSVRRVKRDRVGNFWADSLGFKRDTLTTGWTFNATVLFVGDQAVFAVHGGQPNLRDRQVTRNPLGPLQGWGNALRLP